MAARHRRGALVAVLAVPALLLGLAARARAADGEATEPPIELPEVLVRAPSPYAGAGGVAPTETVTPLRREAVVFDVPAAVTVQDGAFLRQRRMVRSPSDALLRLPGVLVQKTAPLQASPYVRGFTGYQNLLLIDGIRLNNAAFRSGPNQYWSTIDSYTIERLELARGPLSVLYGSDAVGGTVNVLPNRRRSFQPGWHVGGLVSTRVASAENAGFGRLQVEGNHGRLGFLGGLTGKAYGDIESGGGRLAGTGGITELDGDVRFDVLLDRRWSLVLAYQHVTQVDAPRTHTTVDAVPFRGTAVGSELRRDHDQDRDLAYARLVYDDPLGCLEGGFVGVSWHHHRDERDRLRTKGRRDISGFDLDQYGFQAQVQTRTRLGDLTWGVDYYRDESDTWRRDYLGDVLVSESIQGPFGDDGHYDLLGAYVQDELTFGPIDLVLGVRFTYAAAAADAVEDPLAPGNVIRVAKDWTDVVGSARATWHLDNRWNAYGIVAQAFRAPTLHDLTAFDVTGFVETPDPDVDPERFLTFEAGLKTEQERIGGYVAAWYTLLDGTIVKSPTGEVLDGTAVVRKDNVGDGWVWGVEAEAAYRVARSWTAFGNVSWMNGRVDQIDAATGRTVFGYLSRLKPLTMLVGMRYEPPRGRGWAQVEVAFSDREDRLSLSDQADTSRIPPDGTPGWTTVNLRAGYQVTERTYVGGAIENLLDEDYRLHGSGVNEPGLNLVATLEIRM